MEDQLVQIWPVYDQQLNSFLLEIGSEGQGKQASFRKVLPIHGPEGTTWIKKSQAAGLDVRTGYQGYGVWQRQCQTPQKFQARRPQQVDNTQQHRLPALIQDPKINLGPTVKITGRKIPQFDQCNRSVQEKEQYLRRLENQSQRYTKAENLKLFRSASPLLHRVFQSNGNQDSNHPEKAMANSPSSPNYETPHPSSLSSQIQSGHGEPAKMNQQAGDTPNTQALNQKRSHDTADQELDLLHMNKRHCGPMKQSFRPSTPSALQFESRPIISQGTAQSNMVSKLY